MAMARRMRKGVVSLDRPQAPLTSLYTSLCTLAVLPNLPFRADEEKYCDLFCGHITPHTPARYSQAPCPDRLPCAEFY